ncbi:hypothetical protein HK098_007055 [Nowakowskiella sp. JEL0407]|nr:hypothetical protein HK098_007055 [Nowakowskiella sp. JEL0407]
MTNPQSFHVQSPSCNNSIPSNPSTETETNPPSLITYVVHSGIDVVDRMLGNWSPTRLWPVRTVIGVLGYGSVHPYKLGTNHDIKFGLPNVNIPADQLEHLRLSSNGSSASNTSSKTSNDSNVNGRTDFEDAIWNTVTNANKRKDQNNSDSAPTGISPDTSILSRIIVPNIDLSCAILCTSERLESKKRENIRSSKFQFTNDENSDGSSDDGIDASDEKKSVHFNAKVEILHSDSRIMMMDLKRIRSAPPVYGGMRIRTATSIPA